MRAILDKALWGTLLFLFGPSVMVVASWNTLPGDYLYGTKLALERTALAIVSPSYATVGNLQIKYTERRYAEAKQLLSSKQSVSGLPYLQQQIAQTKKAIERAPNKEAQVALAKQYINTLTSVSDELESQKQTMTTSPQPIAFTSPRPTVVLTSDMKEVPTPAQPAGGLEVKNPTSTPTSFATPTPTPIQIAQVTTTMFIPTGQAVVALQIDQTQQNVNQTIADLQTLVDDDNHGRNEGRGQNKNNDQKGNSQDHRQNQDDDGDRRGGSKKINE